MHRLTSLLTLTLPFTLSFALCSAGAAGAQAASCGGVAGLPAGLLAGVYRGTLAGLPITLQLGRESSYFYDNKGLDIELEATHNADKLILTENGPWDNKIGAIPLNACFALTRSGNTLKGTWTRSGQQSSGQQKGQAVTLSRVDVSKLPLKLSATPGLLKLRRDDPYTFIKLNHAWAGAGAKVTEPLSGLAYFRIPGASAALNGALQDRQLQQAASSLVCRSGVVANNSDYNLQIRDTYMTPKLLSFIEITDYYCGGAHPDDSEEGVILDRLTGQDVDINSIWYNLDQAKQHALYQQKLATIKDEYECRSLPEEDMTASYTANLTKAGLSLTRVDLPHVAAVCKLTLVIPYAQLKDSADSSSPYYRDIYR